jgi:GYD domain
MVRFRDYDVVLITEMPNNVNAAVIAIAFAAGGACKAVQTTPLMSTAEALEAMWRKALCVTVEFKCSARLQPDKIFLYVARYQQE